MARELQKRKNRLPAYLLQLIIVAALAVGVFILASHFDLLEKIYDWSRNYESANADELIIVIFFLVFVVLVIHIRSSLKLRQEVRDRQRIEQELQEIYRKEWEIRRELQEELDDRIAYTRALVHELKTPLTPMVAASELLLEELPEGPVNRLARSISRGAATLSSRIDMLTDTAKGELGILKLNRNQTDIMELLKNISEDTEPLTASHKQTMVTDLPESLPETIADQERLRQVVVNFLDNSIKFTPEGGTVTLRAKQQDDRIIIEVEDTGPGMSPEKQQLLFKSRYNKKTQNDRGSGLGLGMFLAAMIVHLHDGEIWVESEFGKGSTFGFSIPIVTDMDEE